jgi:hypothetical protein
MEVQRSCETICRSLDFAPWGVYRIAISLNLEAEMAIVFDL